MRALFRRSAVLVPLAAVPFIPTASPLPREVVPNDNRRAAGTLRGDTLTARFTVQKAHWTPDASHDQQVTEVSGRDRPGGIRLCASVAGGRTRSTSSAFDATSPTAGGA